MNQPIEKLPTVWQLLDERDQLKKKLQEQALTYLSLDTQNQLLYEENQQLKKDIAQLFDELDDLTADLFEARNND
jgi:hypothetical protein